MKINLLKRSENPFMLGEELEEIERERNRPGRNWKKNAVRTRKY
jgi:hypothetical protein